MLNTNVTGKSISDFREIPIEWIFEHYLNLPVKLVGQSVMIKSIFNPKDTKPSMCIFYNERYKEYRFSDFSSGKFGSWWDLLGFLYKDLDNSSLFIKLLRDYESSGGEKRKQIKKSKTGISSFVIRRWSLADKNFWTKYNISSKILEEYHVIPLENLVIRTEVDDNINEIVVGGNYVYGYFNNAGELYKLYQPFSDHKFLTFGKYIQGIDQLKGLDYLGIASSLKDIMSFKSLDIRNVDMVAPQGEGIIFKKDQIEEWKRTYKKIFSLLDNDQPGINAMEKYKKMYDVPYAHLQLSKDLSDSIRDFKVEKTRTELLTILRIIIHG